MQFEDEDIIFIEHEGMKLYPVYSVGKIYGYNKKSADQVFERNKDFLEGNYFILTVKTNGRKTSVACLTTEGIWIYTSRLSVREIPPDRQKKIIKVIQFMARTAQGVVDGKLVPTKQVTINYLEERAIAKDGHNLLMAAVKRFESPKFQLNSQEPYQRESRAVNIDTMGIHIKGSNDKLNAVGLHIKNEAYNARRVLLHAGIDYEHRCIAVREFLDASYPNRDITDMLLTVEEKARISRKCPASQRGIGDFTAVA